MNLILATGDCLTRNSSYFFKIYFQPVNFHTFVSFALLRPPKKHITVPNLSSLKIPQIICKRKHKKTGERIGLRIFRIHLGDDAGDAAVLLKQVVSQVFSPLLGYSRELPIKQFSANGVSQKYGPAT